jgi:hypothetical protein
MLEEDFDLYTIAAFQKTPDASIVDHPDFLRGKDLHFRVKKLFENIKQKFPELQSQQISILTPPDTVFKKEPENPFMSTYGSHQSDREEDFDGRTSQIMTIAKLGDDFDETPKLRDVTSLPELNDRLENKESYSLSRESGLFRPSTFDEENPRESIEELSLPPNLPEKLVKSPLKKKRSRKSLPWWWKSSSKKKSKKKKSSKKRKSTKKKKSPKKDEVKKITIHADKDTIARFRDLNRKEKKSPSKKKKSVSKRKLTKKRVVKRSRSKSKRIHSKSKRTSSKRNSKKRVKKRNIRKKSKKKVVRKRSKNSKRKTK